MTGHQDILFDEQNGLAIVTLNRPKALNAINFEMVKALTQKLKNWAKDEKIKAVLLKGMGDKAFCAGGDVRAMYEAKKHGQESILEHFYQDEYNLNYLISVYPKPYISLLNGITMGGGAGLSIHGRYRIGTEKLIFAMPETTIGFFPDVGGSYFLSRCRDAIGLYLGLTGDRIGLEDCYDLGLITHYISNGKVVLFEEKLKNMQWEQDPFQVVDRLLNELHEKPGKAPIKEKEELIQSCFSHNKVEKIIEELHKQNHPWAKETAKNLEKKSPTSLKVTHKQIALGRNLNLQEGLKMEYRLCQHFMKENEFFEGVRALLVDKDQNPKWTPPKLEDLSESKLSRYFEPIQGKELQFNCEHSN